MKRTVKFLAAIALAGIVLAGCSSGSAKIDKNEVVKLGVVGANNEVWESVKDRLKEENIELEIIEFSDYTQPNAALAEKEIDLNSFQHQIFLDNYNTEHKTDLVSIGNTVNAPLGVYSEKLKDIEDIENGGEIAIPNDTTNGGRALLLLQSAGLIKVDPGAQQTPTVNDITENKRNLKITELDAAQTARVLQDVDASVINSGMAVDAGFIPTEDAIYLEPVDDTSKPYVNIIVARKEDEDNELYQKIVDAYQQDETKTVIDESTKGSSIAAWETFGRK
ncbi:MetQ/NlpA family ABC transporter substrate-binding protein [Enterococcus sp. BWB1-3]|uniref:MetQ/NlpA family ABC transporter substrate-binding protein n=1 Tax=unclassified Enterococcus TaxID=2608891 RepID=UPI00192325A1|nr:MULTISPECIES: MetQ/NlpA family ABC transporter substrate-binding protein [unclassified Enterococcus]MBL1229812.1 MetQ/NlpA family ABC transporter substrate-binding protein [Enterococcus sp. BWB1-3]MCB5952438.1 MetQ/NlpA family ABC transporter substrate-binding protein [Enterococcus sp. BWT-B8]MCB5955390.1 MetQ/NlpA family ABC transporter substrate-binding protein [Enterococcus sp. CWB-B31]